MLVTNCHNPVLYGFHHVLYGGAPPYMTLINKFPTVFQSYRFEIKFEITVFFFEIKFFEILSFEINITYPKGELWKEIKKKNVFFDSKCYNKFSPHFIVYKAAVLKNRSPNSSKSYSGPNKAFTPHFIYFKATFIEYSGSNIAFYPTFYSLYHRCYNIAFMLDPLRDFVKF